MTEPAFDTEILETRAIGSSGRGASPTQMLQAQAYDSHASIHDDATAQKLGFQGGTIEGPTHFSQFAPLVRADLGPGLVRDRLPVRALPQPRLRGRGSAGPYREAEAGRDRLRDRHGQARRHRDVARHRVGRRRQPKPRWSARLGELKPLADPVILRRPQGRHEDQRGRR